MPAEADCLIAANRVPQVGAAKVASLRRAFGSLQAAAQADPEEVALRCKEVQRGCQQLAEAVGVDMQTKNMNLNTTTLMLHLAQETELLAAELRELLKAGQAFKSLTENSTHNA